MLPMKHFTTIPKNTPMEVSVQYFEIWLRWPSCAVDKKNIPDIESAASPNVMIESSMQKRMSD